MSRTLAAAIGILTLGVVTGCITHEVAKAAQPVETQDLASPTITPSRLQRMTEAEKKKVPWQYVQTPSGRWLVHDMNRPAPPVITPGGECGQAPSDAIVLFDGKPESIANWTNTGGGPSRWIIRDGYLESVKGAGDIQSKQPFGSCQLHIEFATPSPAKGTSQDRGNSGIYLQTRYEVQVLDCYENKTYPDGQCGALYGRAVPLVNVCRKPGEWQSYDIIFHRPLFDKDGKVTRKTTFTVLQNGVLIQDHVELEGSTAWINEHAVAAYEPHADKAPLLLQDHANPVRYRNIWLRELRD